MLSRYLEDIFFKSCSTSLIPSGVLSTYFENANSFLISQSIKKQRNLLINSANIYDDRELFRACVYTLIHCFFNLNFIDVENDKPEVGNKYQRGNKRYEVIETGVVKAGCEGVMLQCISRGSDSRIDWLSLDYFYEDYIKLDDDAGRSNRNTFGPISELIKLLTDKNGNISSYPHKFAIICSKKHFQDSFLLQERKAFPYEYVTKNEVAQPNLPLPDFMFYIASSYDAIVDHVLDKDINLDLLVNIQNTNLREFFNPIYTDRIKQVIHIGHEKPQHRESLTWKWTFPEINYYTTEGEFNKQLQKIVIDNPTLNNAVENLVQAVKNLEEKYSIDLKQIDRLVVDLFDVILLNDGKRSINRIRNLESSFSDMLESLLNQKLTHLGYDNEIFVDLVDRYKNVVAQISSKENSKSEEFKNLSEPQYILVPYNQNKQLWKNEIWQLHWHNTEIIDFKQFKALEDISQVLVLGIHNKYLFYAIYGSKHSIKWLLYNSENQLFEKYKKEYSESINRELTSADRFELSGVEFIPEEEKEEVSSVIDSVSSESISDLFDRIFDDQASYDDHYGYETNYEQQLKRIIFTNNTHSDVSPHGLAIVIENDRPILSSIPEIVEGELVRVYENSDHDFLFNKLLAADESGRFQDIMDSSNLWKEAIRSKVGRFASNAITIAREFGVEPRTIEGWIKPNSKTKFPQNIEKLKPYLSDSDYEKITKNCGAYKRLMIAAGRDLSNEVFQYILNGKTGQMLSEFDANFIEKLVDANAPIRRVKEIIRLD